jgi:hypothetical protein
LTPAKAGGNPNVGSFNMLCLPHEMATQVQGMPEITSPQEASALLRGLPKATQ